MSMRWCGRGVDLLLARWGCVFLALAHQCDPIKELKMAIQPITLPFVMFMWPIPLVWKTNTNVQYAAVVSPPEQIYAYMENPQPRIRAVELLYMYEMLPWSIVQSLNVYSVDNNKKKKHVRPVIWDAEQIAHYDATVMFFSYHII